MSFECECGSDITPGVYSTLRHKKSKKHINYIKRSQGIFVPVACRHPNTFESSFADYADQDKVAMWHKTKNCGLLPIDVPISSRRKCWFTCIECKHDFKIMMNNINIHDYWCPYCVSKVLCKKKECTFCYKKSLEYYINDNDLDVEWHESKNGNVYAHHIFKTSFGLYWFRCLGCQHEFTQTLHNIDTIVSLCPYCKESAPKLCEYIECKVCMNNSFEMHPNKKFVACWHETWNEPFIPRDIHLTSSKQYWFQCKKCNDTFHDKVSNYYDGRNPCLMCRCDEYQLKS